ncbi:hypothetical protein [Roseiconus lacunae]
MNFKYQDAVEIGCRRPGDELQRRIHQPILQDNQYSLTQLRVSSTSLPLDSGRRDDLRQIGEGLTQERISPGVDVRVLRFPEILSSSNQSALARVFRDVNLILTIPVVVPIVLDLTSIRICGAGFINGLIASKEKIQACAAEVVIAGDPDRLLSLFQVQRLVPVYPDLQAALLKVCRAN